MAHDKKVIELNINGSDYDIACAPNTTLLEALREKVTLTGTKRGCDTGACGACTVMMDGEAVLACLVLAVDAEGGTIRTIEGLSADWKLTPLQESLVEHGAIQCGFCSPGFVMSATELLKEIPNPGREEITRKLSGNLCRCTGYLKIYDAVEAVASDLSLIHISEPTRLRRISY